MQYSFKNDYFNYFPVFVFNFNHHFFYHSGESISMHLLRYRVLAVKDHSFAPCALHLQQPRLVNNPG